MVKLPPIASMAALSALFADRTGTPPDADAVRKVVRTVIAGTDGGLPLS
jgi:hypothetical protein